MMNNFDLKRLAFRRAPFFIRFLWLIALLFALLPLLSYIGTGFSYAETGAPAGPAYIEKYWAEMTEDEKASALSLLLSGENGFTVPTAIFANGETQPLSEALWYSNGILVYGEPFGGMSAFGPRYWGFDVNGGFFGNNDFPRDSDSGRPAHVKAWLTVEQIYDSAVARGYVGELALDENLFSEAEKRETASLWLDEHPEWRAAGLDEGYILTHFCFNSVISDSGLTHGQFIGVHRSVSSGNLYYQTFGVEAPTRLFLVSDEDPVPPAPVPDDPPAPPASEAVSVRAIARLTGPDVVYVGESFALTDRSLFTVEGTTYQTTSAYRAFGFSHTWSAPGGALFETNETEAALCYETSGAKTVRLALGETASYTRPDGTPVTATLSGTLTASKTIRVLPVPAVDVSLVGPHKANRKEDLLLNVHTHPSRPLSRIEIEIVSEEDPCVYYHIVRSVSDGTETADGYALTEPLPLDTRVTDGRIKARSLTRTGAGASGASGSSSSGGASGSSSSGGASGAPVSPTNDVWTLPFLTKNGEPCSYRYTVTVTDCGGYTATAEGTFTQTADEAPASEIALSDAFYRNESGNKAEIEVRDATPSDGDSIVRIWSFADTPSLSGGASGLHGSGSLSLIEGGAFAPSSYKTLSASSSPALSDRSFGTDRVVSFDKTGVGRFSVKLTARDVWTEETLPEFVTPLDVLTGESTRESQVVNLAPRVSLSVHVAPPAVQFLFLTETEEEQAALEARLSALSSELRANGVSPVLVARSLSPAPVSEDAFSALPSPLRLVKTIVEDSYGHEGGWSFLNFAAAVDDYCLYTVTGTFPGTDRGNLPSAPYTIRAYDAESGALRWSYTLSDAVMETVSDGSFHTPNVRIVTDFAGRYVFFRSGTGKTLVLDARSGAFLTVLNTSIGGAAYSYGEAIYFYRADGLWKIDAGTGDVSLLEGGTFLPKAGQGSSGDLDTANLPVNGIGTAGAVYRGLFTAVEERGEEVVLTAFDPLTEMILRKPLAAAQKGWTVLALDAEGNTILHSKTFAKMVAFDRNGVEYARVGVASSPSVCSASFDENGVCHFVSDGQTIYYSNYFGQGPAAIFARNAYSLTTGAATSYSVASSDGLYRHTNNAVFSIERDGILIEALGRYWTYVYDYGYGAYTEEAVLLRFDVENRTYEIGSVADYGLDAIVELGGRSDSWLFARTDDNNKTAAARVTTRILSEPRTRETLEDLIARRYLRTDLTLSRVLPAEYADTETLLTLLEEAGLIQRETGDSFMPYLTVKTNEPVAFLVSYKDPESDPSRESHWLLSYSDPTGARPAWSAAFSAPPASFSAAGRYLLEHYQIDDTGDLAYDRESNHLRLLVYVTEGEETPALPKALSASVSHTPEWERNRLLWNQKYPDRFRASNVFWTGERLICTAAVEGDAESVTAELKRGDGTAVLPLSASNALLSLTGETNADGAPLYDGSIWDVSWIDAFGRAGPEPFIVTFTASYRDGSTLSEDIPIVFSSETSFFRLHQLL